MMETERLLLRPGRDTDAEALFKYASDPEVGPRAGWPPHKSLAESLTVIRTVFGVDTMWAVELKSTGEAIGCVGNLAAEHSNLSLANDQCEVGCWIAVPTGEKASAQRPCAGWCAFASTKKALPPYGAGISPTIPPRDA